MAATKRSRHARRFLASVRFAVHGIRLAFSEPNMRIHTAAGAIVTAAGFLFTLSRIEWTVLVLTIAGVMAAEMVNTAIEAVVDLVTEDVHPLAKAAKDIAAGAVLVTAAAAVVVGVLLFAPKIMEVFHP